MIKFVIYSEFMSRIL